MERVNSSTVEGYCLSDGRLNVAILKYMKYKYDEPATTEEAVRHTGMYHCGFELQDMAEAWAWSEKAGAKRWGKLYLPRPVLEVIEQK